jgi:hypothetical protein
VVPGAFKEATKLVTEWGRIRNKCGMLPAVEPSVVFQVSVTPLMVIVSPSVGLVARPSLRGPVANH